jgi:hypothetical protein
VEGLTLGLGLGLGLALGILYRAIRRRSLVVLVAWISDNSVYDSYSCDDPWNGIDTGVYHRLPSSIA